MPIMRKAGHGRIINFSSVAGYLGVPVGSLYTSSKFAVEGLTQALQHELGHFGINICMIAPGAFKTQFAATRHFTDGNIQPELQEHSRIYRDFMAEMSRTEPKPFGYGNPEDVAKLVYKVATERKPKFRNPIGKDAKVLDFLKKLLPEPMLAKMLRNSAMPKNLPS